MPTDLPTMIKEDTPNLWTIRNYLGHAKAVAILVNALVQTARLVNLENNLTEVQIGEIANDVLNEYGFIKPVEVKYVLKNGLRNNKLYGRLDYNIIMEWFGDYAQERINAAMDLSDRYDAQAQNEPVSSENAIGWEEYLSRVKQRAENGEKAAQDILNELNKQDNNVVLTAEEIKTREIDFIKWKTQYIKSKTR